MVRENFKKVRRTWLGLLNMILAMATITRAPGNADADTRISESDVFYQRGLALCGSEILRGTTLEVGEVFAVDNLTTFINTSQFNTFS